MLKFLCTVALLLVMVKANDDSTVPYGYFGSKTSYKLVSASEIQVPPGFTSRQIFMLTRHGKRGPTKDFSKKAIPKLNVYKTKFTEHATLCKEDIEAIKNWETIIDTNTEKAMSPRGLDEMKDLALRIRGAFPNLFTRPYTPNDYEILSAPDPRCAESGVTFVQNILNDDTFTEIPVSGQRDIFMFVQDLKKVDENWEEKQNKIRGIKQEFRRGKHMNGVVQRVADKMGINVSELNYEIVFMMYEVATFELSIDHTKVSPWYKIFCEDDLEVFEYLDNIFRQYFNGFEDPFNTKLSCPIAIRLEETLKKKINAEGPEGVFYFTHSNAILSLYVMLGIGNGDSPFQESNYTKMENLKWRTSFFGPWAANVMVVLYANAQNIYHVAFYFNEKLTTINLKEDLSCSICLWSDVQEKLIAHIKDNDCVNLVATNTVKNYEDTHPYWHFGTKTPYKLVSAKDIYVPPLLKPILLFGLFRHATISSSKFDYDRLFPSLEELKKQFTTKAKLTDTDFEAINKWKKSIYFQPNDRDLIDKGRKETKELALRVRNAFPDLFKQANYKALAFNEPRCMETGKIFLQNVYNNQDIVDVPSCNKDDFSLLIIDILKPKNDNKEKYESNQFKNGDHMTKVVDRVKAKTRLDSITIDDVLNMYEACRYERAFDEELIPPWCRVFCREDLEALEYYEELYWDNRFGYGDPSNLKLACPMATRLLKTLEDKINNKGGPGGVFHYVHESNVMNFNLVLGVGKDDNQLKASNYNEMKNRKWVASKYSPWAANVMAVLFEGDNNDYHVAFYINEHITSIPLENDPPCEVCRWSDIQNKLKAFIRDNDCNNFMAENLDEFQRKRKELENENRYLTVSL